MGVALMTTVRDRSEIRAMLDEVSRQIAASCDKGEAAWWIVYLLEVLDDHLEDDGLHAIRGMIGERLANGLW